MTNPLQQKLKITGPSIVTANRTSDGIVIYRTTSGWSDKLGDAEIVNNADDARALWAKAIADDVGAVGSYIAPVELSDDGDIRPGNLREQIRQNGVTFPLQISA